MIVYRPLTPRSPSPYFSVSAYPLKTVCSSWALLLLRVPEGNPHATRALTPNVYMKFYKDAVQGQLGQQQPTTKGLLPASRSLHIVNVCQRGSAARSRPLP